MRNVIYILYKAVDCYLLKRDPALTLGDLQSNLVHSEITLSNEGRLFTHRQTAGAGDVISFMLAQIMQQDFD